MIDAAGDLLSRLNGLLKTAAGWQARCPAHEDDKPSLCVSKGDDGRWLLFCQAGCPIEAVVQALGLKMADLMGAGDGHENGSQHANGNSFGRIVAEYDYRDQTGALLFQAVRFDPKNFRQRAPKDGSGWTWMLNGVRRVLYRLPELLAADPNATVFVCEGEKDVDNLRARGLVATCNPMGAGKWRPEYSESLRGRKVAVIADNDQAGRDHAETVANSTSGIAAAVKVVSLPGLPEHGDASDWLASGGTAEQLAAIVEAAPDWAPTSKKPRRTTAPSAVSSSTDLRPASARTDSANASRLAAIHGNDLRWCDPWGKWLAWDGRRWALDAERRVDAMAKGVAQALWKQTAELLPEVDFPTARELTSFARGTAGARGIANMLALARSEPEIPILPAKLDGDPWALNVQNGTLDLQTGKLRPHDRTDLLTKLCPTAFDPDAKCPNWEQMLSVIMANSADLITFLQRALGYSLTGSVAEQSLFLLWGKGSNGKSTFINAVLDVIGTDYAMQAPDGLLMVKRGDSHPTERADLFGKRFVSSVEVEDGARLAESLVKQLTGGDSVRARRMREDHWQFTPTHKLWMAANHKPTIRGTDHGIWRRVKLLPFVVTIADVDQDKDLPEKLKAERPGILAWAVRGCLDWQQRGLPEPPEVKAATAEYRAEMDVIGAFVAECCVESERFGAKAGDVYAAYGKWCQVNGEYAVNQRRFGLAMSERGVERYKNNGTWYRGLGLVTEGTEPSEPGF
jgi:putative DNA primase/helicase